jgi:group I intron endonuclease
MIGIYRIYNVVTKKSYIGSSTNIAKRKIHHFYVLKKNKSHSPKLQSSYNKHGEHSFLHEIIELCAREELINRERYWIEMFDSVNKGYNCSNDTYCATRGMKHTQESKAKMSIAQKTANQCPKRRLASSIRLIKYNKTQKGKPKTKEHIQKISEANMGRKATDSQREKQRLRKIENPVKYWLGKKRSYKDIKKMSESHKGKERPYLRKPIIQLDLDMNEINRFESISIGAKKLGILRTSIKNNLCGLSKTCNKSIFIYAPL